MKKFIALTLSALTLSLAAGGALAADFIDLATAKARGLVGEKVDGYIGFVTSNPSVEVMQLVDETNKGREKIYKEMAAKQRIEMFQVQQMAADKLYSLEKKGNFVQQAGSWARKD